MLSPEQSAQVCFVAYDSDMTIDWVRDYFRDYVVAIDIIFADDGIFVRQQDKVKAQQRMTNARNDYHLMSQQ